MQVPRATRIWIAVALFAFALLLRLIGIGWGLKNDLHNQSYHPDEPVILAYSQNIEPTQLKFTPGFYNYGTLYLTILRVASDVTSAYTGAPDPKSDDSYWAWVSRVHLAGRILSALAGAATALLLFFIGYRLFGLYGGLAAGLVVAVAPGHVIHSRFQTVDVIATFFLVASAFCALKLLLPASASSDQADSSDESDKSHAPLLWRLAVFSGVFAGLSAGTKYTGILALLTLYAVLFFLPRESKRFSESGVGLGLIGTVAALATFLITTPGVLLEQDKFLKDFVYEMTHTATGHGLVFAHTSSGFLYHFTNLLVGFGLLVTLVGTGGLIYAAIKRHPWAVALLAFFLVYYLLIGRAEVKFLRYTFPLYLGIAIGFGYVISQTQLKPSWTKFGIAFLILVVGGIDGAGLVGAAKASVWMADPDPRDRAATFIKKDVQGKPGATAGYAKDPWTWSVPLFKDSTVPRMPMGLRYQELIKQLYDPSVENAFWRATFLARMTLMQSAADPRPVLFYSPVPLALGGTAGQPVAVAYHDFDVRLLTEEKPDYVSLTSLEASAVERLSHVPGLQGEEDAAVKQYLEFVGALQRDYSLVRVFGSPAPGVEDMQYVQPQVFVWKRKAPR